MSENFLQCYNRGCGQKYEPDKNTDESCRHHPGEPFFHDAYKGWSCCSKKCTDFTEFLNIKGCTLSKHSNVKPPEPEKPQKPADPEEVIDVKPLPKVKLTRPPLDTEMTVIKPIVAPAVLKQLENLIVAKKDLSDEIPVGTNCKNGGCTATYEGPQSNDGICTYHPGCPIFHEGMKYWSCCQRKTTDFNAFLNQVGCETGKHVWIKEGDNSDNVKCRWDFHQTGTHVIVSIYAKQYCPNASVVKLNPIRLYANLLFPQQSGASFNMDVELCGVVDVSQTKVNMYGTKVEISMKKAEPCSWSKLNVGKVNQNTKTKVDDLTPKVEGVDLGDL